MGRLSRHDLDEEWRRSRDVLAAALGDQPVAASVPGGFLSEQVLESAAHAGYGILMTSQPTARVRRVDGMSVIGRYGIWASTPARQVAAYTRRDRGARARLWVEWRVKTATKRMSPAAYQGLRRLRARF